MTPIQAIAQPAHIIKTNPGQSDLNLELLNFVNQRGHTTWAELFAAFGDGSDSEPGSIKRFSKKLEYLLYTQKLQATGKARSRVFSIGPMAGKVAAVRGRVNAHAGQVDGNAIERPYPHLQCLGEVTPPRQYDAMHGEPYTHVLPAPTRLGALDYKRWASHGHQC